MILLFKERANKPNDPPFSNVLTKGFPNDYTLEPRAAEAGILKIIQLAQSLSNRPLMSVPPKAQLYEAADETAPQAAPTYPSPGAKS